MVGVEPKAGKATEKRGYRDADLEARGAAQDTRVGRARMPGAVGLRLTSSFAGSSVSAVDQFAARNDVTTRSPARKLCGPTSTSSTSIRFGGEATGDV